jgi:hypothetical protein
MLPSSLYEPGNVTNYSFKDPPPTLHLPQTRRLGPSLHYVRYSAQVVVAVDNTDVPEPLRVPQPPAAGYRQSEQRPRLRLAKQ